PRYWADAAAKLTADRGASAVAVTAGAWQDADNWLLYPFIGRRLQNRLLYVPIERPGATVSLGPDYYETVADAADFGAWLARLRASGARYVVSFKPASIELAWMERRPDLFERVSGDGKQWGAYRVKRSNSSSSNR
ncbi:MAG: hypothetical protein K8I02_00165, partial [Candidatus Methylomirabilis sp.]|nr:hypothetical protein [Deltaproteobacteria bacterium]